MNRRIAALALAATIAVGAAGVGVPPSGAADPVGGPAVRPAPVVDPPDVDLGDLLGDLPSPSAIAARLSGLRSATAGSRVDPAAGLDEVLDLVLGIPDLPERVGVLLRRLATPYDPGLLPSAVEEALDDLPIAIPELPEEASARVRQLRQLSASLSAPTSASSIDEVEIPDFAGSLPDLSQFPNVQVAQGQVTRQP